MEKISFNENWEFYPAKNGLFGETGAAPRKVTLPHDGVIGTEREADAESGSAKGFYRNGSFVYRKVFTLPREYENRVVRFLFEGVYMNAVVWINGEHAGQCRNGYREFIIDGDALLKAGEENEIKVTCRTGEDSRWYSGAGIYRDVYMLVGDKVHIAPSGMRITTLSADEKMASLSAELTIENREYRNRTLLSEMKILDMKGATVAKERRIVTFYGKTREEKLSSRLYIENPLLWSIDSPILYTCITTLSEGDREIDRQETPFGIRTLALDPLRGLQINGKTVKLYGGCIHHDNGVLGSATIGRAEERRAELLKSAGYNAVRMAHHPASPALLDACDRIGLVVMDELGDMWNVPKSTEDYSSGFGDDYLKDIESLIDKDYNHPSVVMYSIGNEIPEMGKPSGGVLARELAREIRRRDGSRFITAGVNGMVSNMEEVFHRLAEKSSGSGVDGMNGIISELGSRMKEIQCEEFIVNSTRETMEVLDIAGYNYAEDRYLKDAEQFDNWISVGSETFPKDLAKNWDLVMNHSPVIGDFSWTSWDYLGEAGIGRNVYDRALETGGISAAFPYFIAYCGDFDITGRRRPQSYYREIVVGNRSEPYISVQKPEHYGKKVFNTAWSWSDSIHSWSWQGYEGKKIKVEVYGKADEIELFLDGKSLGKQTVPLKSSEKELAYCTVFDTVYQPGRLEASAIISGKETGRCLLETASENLTLAIELDKREIPMNDRSLAYAFIRFTDEKGRIDRNRFDRITVNVRGEGVLQGLGSADPMSGDSFFEDSYSAYYGELLAVIRPTSRGRIVIDAVSGGFETVSCELIVR